MNHKQTQMSHTQELLHLYEEVRIGRQAFSMNSLNENNVKMI